VLMSMRSLIRRNSNRGVARIMKGQPVLDGNPFSVNRQVVGYVRDMLFTRNGCVLVRMSLKREWLNAEFSFGTVYSFNEEGPSKLRQVLVWVKSPQTNNNKNVGC
jgi:hypothetical protein